MLVNQKYTIGSVQQDKLIKYLATCLERIQNESSEINLQMIRENLDKKRKKRNNKKLPKVKELKVIF